ncbi:hypothetical protein PVAND_002091 [Polypedilum vanderplanki]|uniref:Short-chain dehydrogenase n=1 Tax=Polypedilum vanderplanki TaxID=319348 RepID=A0A9J6BR60_POLVA|nr:hypothetical protein PVAND_002091 [Polypedilum vanderplanki]
MTLFNGKYLIKTIDLNFKNYKFCNEISLQLRFKQWIGKTAIVTRASAGIGVAIVRDFANAGTNVIAIARRLEKCKRQRYTNECDVFDKVSIYTAFDEIEEKFDSAQILVNNDGIAI